MRLCQDSLALADALCDAYHDSDALVEGSKLKHWLT